MKARSVLARRLRGVALLVACVAWVAWVAFAGLGCRRHRGRGAPPPRRHPLHGMLASRAASPENFPALVTWLRALAGSSAPSLPSPPPFAVHAPGARVFVSYFVAGAEPVVATGLGPSLADSIERAAAAARPRVDAAALASARIALEIVVSASSRPLSLASLDAEQLGRQGFAWAAPGDAPRLGFVLASELATRGLLGEDEDGPSLDREKLEALLRDRWGGTCETCAITSFSTVAAIESRPSGPVRPLRAGRLPRPPEADVTVASVREHLRLAAEHLARSVHDDGRFDYLYDAIHDVADDESYNWLRHAGSTAALFAAYQELNDPQLLTAARRALDRLERHLRVAFGKNEDDVEGGASYLPASSNPLGPIGGTGLSLLAFSAAASVGERGHLPRMRSLGRFLVRQLADDGHFEPFSPDGAPGEVVDVLYYPGEAMLGLLRLHAIDPDPVWFEAATRAARHRLGSPYATKKGHLRDYWFSFALGMIVRRQPDAELTARIFGIAEQTMRDQDDDEARLAEGHGAFASLPNPSPTGTSLEAYADDIELARLLGRDEARLRTYAVRAATLLFWDQLDAETAYYVKNPPRALGGVRGIPWGGVTRIDDDQHVMMGYLGLLRVLRP